MLLASLILFDSYRDTVYSTAIFLRRCFPRASFIGPMQDVNLFGHMCQNSVKQVCREYVSTKFHTRTDWLQILRTMCSFSFGSPNFSTIGRISFFDSITPKSIHRGLHIIFTIVLTLSVCRTLHFVNNECSALLD